jgi:hypothetical protein
MDNRVRNRKYMKKVPSFTPPLTAPLLAYSLSFYLFVMYLESCRRSGSHAVAEADRSSRNRGSRRKKWTRIYL